MTTLGETYLKSLRTFKTRWRIRVKILHMWTQFTPGFGETLDLIVGDETGSKMQASIKKAYIPRFQKDLKLGDWKIIDTFTVTDCNPKFKLSTLDYKITFTYNTEVSKSDPMSDSNFLQLANFVAVKENNMPLNVALDILGQIVSVGKFETLYVKQKQTKKLDFQIRDSNDERMPCTLWGNFAETVYNACQNLKGDEKTLVLIRFAKIHTFKGDISITNAWDASDVLINPLEYPEVEQMMRMLPSDGLQVTVSEPSFRRDLQVLAKGDSYIEYPRKSIAELLSSLEEGKWRILASIAAIDTDRGWYYISHNGCNKKVELVREANTQLKVPNKYKKLKFWCEECGETVTNVTARYKLHVSVVDQTGDTKLMLFDSFAEKLITKSASELLNGNYEEIEDPTDIPDAIKNLSGKSFLFLTHVDRANIHGGKKYYKVSRVWLGSEITKEEFDIDSESFNEPSFNGSADQEVLMLTNSSENSNGANSFMSTPSSKRSGDEIKEIAEHSSSTKKICTRGNLKDELDQVIRNVIVNIDEEDIKDESKNKDNDSVGELKTTNLTTSIDVEDQKVDFIKVKQERYKE